MWTSAGHRALAGVLELVSARRVARACGLTPAAISLLRCGHTRYPDLPTAFALERRFGIAAHLWVEQNRARSRASKSSSLTAA